MIDIRILTPSPLSDASPRWTEVLAAYQRALVPIGAKLVPAPWRGSDMADLARADLVLALLSWGYHKAPGAWLDALDAFAATGVRLANPASVLRWNTDKRYLEALTRAGVATTPTLFVDFARPEDLAEAGRRFGTKDLVLKPTISGAAFRTLRLSPGDPIVGGPQGPAMIQPLLKGLDETGEVSLLYFDRVFSHAVRKVAKAGDFRIQEELGGRNEAILPDAAMRATAEAALECIQAPLLYARVDIVRQEDGRWGVMELELIEPDLFLAWAGDGGSVFMRAVEAWALRGREGAQGDTSWQDALS